MKYSNSSQSNSKSEDTSLDEIFDNHGQVVGYGDYYQTETLADIKIEIMAWHKAERAKLFEQIRSEAETFVRDKKYKVVKAENGAVEEMMGNEFIKAVPLEALTRLEQK